MLAKLTVFDRSCLQAGIGTRLVKGNRVEACKHSDIRQDRCIVLTMAVTVRADILYQRNMEARTSMTDSLCILRHFPVEKLVCTAVWIVNRIKTAGTDAATASFAFVIVNDCFFIHIGNCIASAFFCTAVAATTDIRIDRRFSTGMLLHLSGAASASHTDIFQCTAKARCLMAFEMAQADKDICVHDRMANQCCFAVFSVDNRNFYFIGSAQTVSDDNLTTGRNGIKSIQICAVKMFQRILSAAWIQRIAVCQKRKTALLFAEIGNHFRIIRAKKRHVS